MVRAGGVPYADVRGSIKSGDLLFLHHDFVASWYGLQVEMVQDFTGPFAHIAMFDWVQLGGEARLVVYESVVPDPRVVLVSATAEETGGFFWMPLDCPITPDEREAIWRELGNKTYGYDKLGAIQAGLGTLPPGEDNDPRRWCSKFVALARRRAGIDLGPDYVPSTQAVAAVQHTGRQPQFVRLP